MALSIVPSSRRIVGDYLRDHHRHSSATIAGNFGYLAVVDETARIRGVGTLGWPAARGLDDGATLEVTRVCTDGARNACSMLYGALARMAKAMGARRLYTYTLEAEHGASLRAAGFKIEADQIGGGGWDRPNRSRRNMGNNTGAKRRWVKIFPGGYQGERPDYVPAESTQATLFDLPKKPRWGR